MFTCALETWRNIRRQKGRGLREMCTRRFDVIHRGFTRDDKRPPSGSLVAQVEIICNACVNRARARARFYQQVLLPARATEVFTPRHGIVSPRNLKPGIRRRRRNFVISNCSANVVLGEMLVVGNTFTRATKGERERLHIDVP